MPDPRVLSGASTPEALQDNEGVRVRRAPACYACGEAGVTLYRDQRDAMYDAPGTWNVLRCRRCAALWLDPTPVPEDIAKLYRDYHTHVAVSDTPRRGRGLRTTLKSAVLATRFGYDDPGVRAPWRAAARMLCTMGLLRDGIGGIVMWLDGTRRGRLLDVGCGRGEFLRGMKELGWDVSGVEPDGAAAAVAETVIGAPVTCGTVEDARFPAASFDAVTMSHVIEHLPDSVGTLAECGRLLTPGGRLVVTTPNVESLGHHRFFHASWRGLEVPRHLRLFSVQALRTCAERAGLTVVSLRTSARSARWMALASQRPPRGRAKRAPAWRRTVTSVMVAAAEHALVRRQPAGEEIVMVARRSDGS